MVQGLDRREAVEDLNKPKPLEASSVPLAPVQSPQHSSFKHVGDSERQLAEALGGFQAGLTDYIEKKKPEWELEGMMAYAEAKTEQDIVSKGNRFVTAGYMTMKARAANLEWLAAQQIELENNPELKAMDSKTYQQYLMDSFRPMQKSVAGNDKFTNNLLMAMSADNFPRLVQQHLHKQNEFRKEETKQAAVDWGTAIGRRLSSADANKDDEAEFARFMTRGSTGLDPDDERKVQVSVARSLVQMGNERVIDYFGTKTEAPRTPKNAPKGLRDFIGMAESGSRGYDAVVGNDDDITPTTMTLGEIKEWAKGRLKQGKGTAIGRYQVLVSGKNPETGKYEIELSTFVETQKNLGLSDDTVFDYKTQDSFADALMEKRGLSQYLEDGDVNAFLHRLSQEWAALPKDDSGESFYHEVNGNRALVSFDDAVKMIQRAPLEVNAVDNLMALKLPLEDIVDLKNDMAQASVKRSQEFTNTRLNAEQDIQELALTTGNEEAVRNKVMEYKEKYGFSDQWANSVHGATGPLIEKYEKTKQEENELRYAIENNAVRHLTPQKQEKAFDLILAETQAVIQNAGTDLSPEQVEEAVRSQMVDASIRLGVVDRYTDGWMKTALHGTLVDKDGVPNSELYPAYVAWARIYNADKKLAGEYAGDKKDLLYEALSLDSYKDGSIEAITRAAQWQQRRDQGQEDRKLSDPVELQKAITRSVNSQKVGLIDYLLPTASKTNASDRGWFSFNRQPDADERRRIANDTRLHNAVARRAVNIMNKQTGRSEKSAALQAADDVMAQSVILGGNIITPPLNPFQPTFKEAAGFDRETQLKDSVFHEALIEYMNADDLDQPGVSVGVANFGKSWNGIELFDGGFLSDSPVENRGALPGLNRRLGESIKRKAKGGLPKGTMIDYNYDTQMIIMSVPQSIDNPLYHPNTVVIPARELGNLIKRKGDEEILKGSE